MKITISNKTAIVLLNILQLKFFIWLGGLFFLSFFAFGLTGLFDKVSGLLGWLIALMLPTLYMVYVIVDSYTFASNTYVELKDNNIDVYFKNLLRQGNIILPVSQVESVNLSQSVLFRIFGISQIIFIQESGVITISWGYDYKDALAFVKEFGDKYKIKISK